MKVLGITGGVGAGKSTILDYLQRRWGAHIILADEVGRRLQKPGEAGYVQIVEAFGPEFLQADGSLNRQKLAAVVFADAGKLALLNGIMHPAVKTSIIEEIENERQKGGTSFCVIEAALLLEERYDLICDEIWYVEADAETRIRRLAKSRGYTREKSLQIMKNQLAREMYLEKCKFVIDNSSDFLENTYEQIDKGLMEHGFL